MRNLLFPLAIVALAGCDAATMPEAKRVDEPAETRDAPKEPLASVMRPEVAAPEIQAPEPPQRPAPLVLRFDERSDALGVEAKTRLDAWLTEEILRGNDTILVRGHSDSRGYDGDNLVASRRRAEVARDYLVDKGIEETRIRVIALGENRPVAPNAKPDGSDNPEGRAKNRRVELVLQPADESVPDTRQGSEAGSPASAS